VIKAFVCAECHREYQLFSEGEVFQWLISGVYTEWICFECVTLRKLAGDK